MINCSEIDIKRGQTLTSIRSLSAETGLTHRSTRTSLKNLENSHFLTQQPTHHYSIITICNYDKYQSNYLLPDTHTDTDPPKNDTHPDTHSDTKQEDKKIKNKKNNNIYCEDAQKVLDYLNEKTGRHFKKPYGLIARFKEGYTFTDAIKVIDNKLKDERFQEFDSGKYMRPETLFCEKHFDSYLNEKGETKGERLERMARERGLI